MQIGDYFLVIDGSCSHFRSGDIVRYNGKRDWWGAIDGYLYACDHAESGLEQWLRVEQLQRCLPFKDQKFVYGVAT